MARSGTIGDLLALRGRDAGEVLDKWIAEAPSRQASIRRRCPSLSDAVVVLG
jgi:hypothetical protein